MTTVRDMVDLAAKTVDRRVEQAEMLQLDLNRAQQELRHAQEEHAYWLSIWEGLK